MRGAVPPAPTCSSAPCLGRHTRQDICHWSRCRCTAIGQSQRGLSEEEVEGLSGRQADLCAPPIHTCSAHAQRGLRTRHMRSYPHLFIPLGQTPAQERISGQENPNGQCQCQHGSLPALPGADNIGCPSCTCALPAPASRPHGPQHSRLTVTLGARDRSVATGISQGSLWGASRRGGQGMVVCHSYCLSILILKVAGGTEMLARAAATRLSSGTLLCLLCMACTLPSCKEEGLQLLLPGLQPIVHSRLFDTGLPPQAAGNLRTALLH